MVGSHKISLMSPAWFPSGQPLQTHHRGGVYIGPPVSGGAPAAFPPDVKSASLDGMSDRIDFGNVFNPDLYTSPVASWNIWINPDTVSSGYNGVFGNYSTSAGRGYGLISDTRLLWYQATDPTHRLNIATGNIITPGSNTWLMVSVVTTNATAAGAAIFLNAVQQSVSAPEDALNGSTVSSSGFSLGNMGTASPYFFHGQQDLFVFYPGYALTQSDINALYASGNPVNVDPRNLSAGSHLGAFVPIGEGTDSTSLINELISGNNGTPVNFTSSNFVTNIP